jgi:tetratricopeptide (TPR) repeat protein
MPAVPDDLLRSGDPFIENAVAEYRHHVIDQPLWEKSLAQAAGDADKALPAYLRYRAVALRMLRRVNAAQTHTRTHTPTPTPEPTQPASSATLKPAPRSNRRLWMAGGALASVIVLALGAWFFLRDSEGGSDGWVTAGKPPALRPARTSIAAQPVEKAPPPGESSALEVLRSKVRDLKAAGNWNVFTLYASEWTRLEPLNPLAWNQLSMGYQSLRQLDEAADAATRAATLAATNALLWREVGMIRLRQNRYEAAQQAFQTAATIDGSDVLSLVGIGAIELAYAKLPEAKAALERALLANPVDASTVCLKNLIARKQAAPPDILAASRRQIVLDTTCLGPMAPYDALASVEGTSSTAVAAAQDAAVEQAAPQTAR